MKLLQISVCKIKKGRGGTYVRDGMSIEIIGGVLDTHSDVLTQAQSVFQDGGKVLALFTLSGDVLTQAQSAFQDGGKVLALFTLSGALETGLFIHTSKRHTKVRHDWVLDMLLVR